MSPSTAQPSVARTRKFSQEEAQGNKRSLTLHEALIHRIMNGQKPYATEKANYGHGEWTRVELWDATSATGGIVVFIHHYPLNQSDAVDVHYFEDVYPRTSERFPIELRIALDNLYVARGRAYAQQSTLVGVA